MLDGKKNLPKTTENTRFITIWLKSSKCDYLRFGEMITTG